MLPLQLYEELLDYFSSTVRVKRDNSKYVRHQITALNARSCKYVMLLFAITHYTKKNDGYFLSNNLLKAKANK